MCHGDEVHGVSHDKSETISRCLGSCLFFFLLLKRIVYLGLFLIGTLASTSQYLQEEGLQTVLHITRVLCSTLNVSGIREMSRNLEDKPYTSRERVAFPVM